jgi:hypothetical protein
VSKGPRVRLEVKSESEGEGGRGNKEECDAYRKKGFGVIDLGAIDGVSIYHSKNCRVLSYLFLLPFLCCSNAKKSLQHACLDPQIDQTPLLMKITEISKKVGISPSQLRI